MPPRWWRCPWSMSAKAAGGDTPSPPTNSSKDKKKKHDKSSSIDDPKFLEGYRAAYATIYDRHDYTSAIAQLKALGQDERRRRCQSDRLLLPQARRLQGLAGLVRARAPGRPEPCPHLAVLRTVAARTGQPRIRPIPPRPHQADLRHRLRRVQVAGDGPRPARGHRPRLLIAANESQLDRRRPTAPFFFGLISSALPPRCGMPGAKLRANRTCARQDRPQASPDRRDA